MKSQLAPARVDHATFLADQESFLRRLEKEGLDVTLYASAFHPYPFAVTPDQLAVLIDLQRSVYRAVLAIVRHFPTDPRIPEVIQLPGAERALLDRIADLPYRPGSFRPDFLHAADGRPMITEINARFPLNGFLSSALLNRCVAGVAPGLRPLPPLALLEGALRARLGEDGPIGIVKSSEPGWDINLLCRLWGDRCEMVAPAAVTPAHLNRWRSVLLELHQDELFTQLPAGLLERIAEHEGVCNDLRTILIVHDKRLLSLLSTSRVLEDYLEPGEIGTLRRHVVPTWVKGLAPEKVKEAMAQPDGWLAKPPRSGKGKGILVSSQLTPSAWRERLAALPDDWLLQPYVEQQEFPIVSWSSETSQPILRPMKVVGVLPQLDGLAFGAGMFRAAADPIVNVARGGLILTPALTGGDR